MRPQAMESSQASPPSPCLQESLLRPGEAIWSLLQWDLPRADNTCIHTGQPLGRKEKEVRHSPGHIPVTWGGVTGTGYEEPTVMPTHTQEIRVYPQLSIGLCHRQ